MIEFVSWAGVAVIGVFALVGFTGVVVTSLLTVARALLHHESPSEATSTREVARAA